MAVGLSALAVALGDLGASFLVVPPGVDTLSLRIFDLLHSGRIVVVFQPHRYTRTRDLFESFATAFHDADVLVLTEIYPAGEEKITGVESAALAAAIESHGHRSVRFVADLDRVGPELLPDLRYLTQRLQFSDLFPEERSEAGFAELLEDLASH